jgi:uncharacterized membrane protein
MTASVKHHAPTPAEVVAALRRIVALALDTPERAQEAMDSALRLQERGLIEVHDAVFVLRHRDGTVEIVDSPSAAPVAAAVPSTLFGALVGTLIAGPLGLLIGGVLAGGSGAIAAKLIATGIPSRVVAELQELTRPGQTVLALMVSDIAGMAVIEELRRFRGARVVYGQLPEASLELMRQVLAERRS